jgi:GNAT superfamily N-acetyltransferase
MTSVDFLKFTIIDKTKIDKVLKSLLSLSVGNATNEKVEATISNYIKDENSYLVGAYKNKELVGIIGLVVFGKCARITHLATNFEHRKENIGRVLINHAIDIFRLDELVVETDADAKDFYSKCGFELQKVQGKHCQRFKGVLQKAGFNELDLRCVLTENEWFHYHRIRKAEIFDRSPHLNYDYNHPSITNPNCQHYVFYKGASIIGVICLDHLNDTDIAFRMVAVDGDLKNLGYGTHLIQQAEDITRTRNYKKILLHAYVGSYNFYQRLGYIEMEFNEDNKTFEQSIDMGKLL